MSHRTIKISFGMLTVIGLLLGNNLNTEKTFAFETKSARPFKSKIHSEINQRALERVLQISNKERSNPRFIACRKTVRKGQLKHDLRTFFSARAHFDNCTFEKSIAYINNQLRKHSIYFNKAQNARSDKRRDKALKKILKNSGKIFHAIQDFYSHSDYVGLSELKYANLDNVPAFNFWTPNGQQEILKKRNEGMITGNVFWAFPKKCKKGNPSHGSLAKDTASYKTGKKTTKWTDAAREKPLNRHQAAVFLAEKSSYEFLLHTFRKYPMLWEYCGSKPR